MSWNRLRFSRKRGQNEGTNAELLGDLRIPGPSLHRRAKQPERNQERDNNPTTSAADVADGQRYPDVRVDCRA